MALPLNTTPGSIVAPKGSHILLTGPISGTVTKADGSVVDVSGEALIVDDQDEADEISFLIGERYVAEGHPNLVEVDDDGNVVQYQFEHAHAKKFDKHPSKHKGKPFGVARKKG